MSNRRERLKKLVEVQEQIRALHETRHAGHLAAAASAQAEAAALAERFDAPDSLAGLFPELYHRRMAEAVAVHEKNHELAKQEAGQVAAATMRVNAVMRAYQAVRAWDEREKSDRERLDIIERKQFK
jgi:hypothetical protein